MQEKTRWVDSHMLPTCPAFFSLNLQKAGELDGVQAQGSLTLCYGHRAQEVDIDLVLEDLQGYGLQAARGTHACATSLMWTSLLEELLHAGALAATLVFAYTPY